MMHYTENWNSWKITSKIAVSWFTNLTRILCSTTFLWPHFFPPSSAILFYFHFQLFRLMHFKSMPERKKETMKKNLIEIVMQKSQSQDATTMWKSHVWLKSLAVVDCCWCDAIIEISYETNFTALSHWKCFSTNGTMRNDCIGCMIHHDTNHDILIIAIDCFCCINPTQRERKKHLNRIAVVPWNSKQK